MRLLLAAAAALTLAPAGAAATPAPVKLTIVRGGGGYVWKGSSSAKRSVTVVRGQQVQVTVRGVWTLEWKYARVTAKVPASFFTIRDGVAEKLPVTFSHPGAAALTLTLTVR